MRKFLFTLGILSGALGIAIVTAFAVDQMKTNESLIYSSNTAISSTVNTAFTLYVGDNFSGVASPIKSVYFVASGVYTGNGTIAFTIDSDGATLQSFTLPNVGSTPTPFEFIYKDPSNKISPTSAGSYSYTLNMTPSGVTLYGLGIKMTETHRYAPPACADGASTNEKVKTTSTFVASYNNAITTIQNSSINLYIGDNMNGVASPIKSVYFVASGVYTGNGTIAFTIDSDGATLQSFTLPNVGSTPTPFEFIYKDPSNKISPTSAGSYSYTLNMTPSGVTLYGLGIKMTETHRYKPPTCGGTPYGDLISAVFDSTGSADGAGYNSVMWKGVLGGAGQNEGKVRFQFAASDSSSGPWTYLGGATCGTGDWFDPGGPDVPIELKGTACQTAWNNKRYFRYKVELCSNDCVLVGANTPTVDDIIVSWAP